MAGPRIDFYVLDAVDAGIRERAACRVVEMAWRRGHRVHVCVASDEKVRVLDDLLWTWRDDSFVPHAVRERGGPKEDGEVTLGAGAPPDEADDVLVNLGDEIPVSLERFARVIEVLDGTRSMREAGRERFRRYRELGCELNTHRLRTP